MRSLLTIALLFFVMLSCDSEDERAMIVDTKYNQAWKAYSIDPDASIRTINEALKIAEEIEYEKGIAKSSYLLATLYSQKEKYAKAIDYLLISYKYYDKIRDKKNLSRSLIALGSMNFEINNYKESIDYINRSFADGDSDPILTSYAYYYLGQAYIANEQKSEALKTINDNLKTIPNTSDKTLIALKYSQAGFVYLKMEDYNEAIKYLQQSIQTDNSVGNLANCFNNIGYSYFKLNVLDKAIENVNKSISYNDPAYLGGAYRTLAFIHIAKSNIDLGVKELNKSQEFFENHEETSKGFEMISTFYKSKGDLGNALIYSEKSRAAFKERTKRVEAKHNEGSNAKIIINNFNHSEVVSYYRLLIERNLAVSILLIIVIALIISYVKNLKRKQKLKDDHRNLKKGKLKAEVENFWVGGSV